MTQKYTEITECRACGGSNLRTYLDLTDQPLANSYHKGEELPRFPLKANVCEDCYHNQLSVVVDPDEMFKHYLYVSGTSKTLKDYFNWFSFLCGQFADYVDNNNAPLSVLDIACNDGTQLDSFKARGWRTYGVDPAENLVPTAREKGHDVELAYWNAEVAQRFRCKSCTAAPFDIITAQNVFAHTHDVLGFLEACKLVMHEKTVLMIQTSQADMFVNGEFDTMYHEHLSFFNVSSMKALCARAGLHFERVFKTNIHGNSYVFCITLNGDLLEKNVQEAYNSEFMAGLYNTATYDDFAKKAKKVVTDLKTTVENFQAQGYHVVGYGAAAKGMTVLNFGGIKLDWIVDDNELKHDRLTPGMNIPIHGTKSIQVENDLVFVPLAWNFWKEISEKIKTLRPNNADIFVRYFPTLQITK